jgi:hypothetical protein
MKIGGSDPGQGPVGGIHWHVNQKVEYVATDAARQKIPWVRVTDSAGQVTVYETEDGPLKPGELAGHSPRLLDCIDCHNRPSHSYRAPNTAINAALAAGRLDAKQPLLKKRAVEALTGDYRTADEARQKIAAALSGHYDAKTVAAVQEVYRQNFFPEMKVNWRAYPNNVGHTVFPGCYRCHDGKHKAADGRRITHDCTACHVILAQGTGPAAATLSPAGLEFQHPTDIGDLWKDMNCSECHTGGRAD